MPIYEMGIDISHPLVGAQHVDHVHFDVIPKTSEMDGQLAREKADKEETLERMKSRL